MGTVFAFLSSNPVIESPGDPSGEGSLKPATPTSPLFL